MALVLVQYSDSDSDEGSLYKKAESDAYPPPTQPVAGSTVAVKRKREEPSSSSNLPPLPAAFHDLYSVNMRVSTCDDPSLHGGRKRAVPHIDGNWPSHVYLEWVPSHTESEKLQDLIDSISASIHNANSTRANPIPVPDIIPLLRSPLGASLPLHISLSRTLQIQTGDRDACLDTLTSSLRKAAVRPFGIRFASLKWVPNFERNRWFLVLSIAKPPQNELNRLLDACNEAAERCGYPGLYTGGPGDGPVEDNTSVGNTKKRRKTLSKEKKHKYATPGAIDRSDNFHISIAWNLEGPAPEWMALVQNIALDRDLLSSGTHFDVVKAKIGNVVHNIEL
ncbi:uncharacterized protein BDR25DRAFT_266781, partial [Lindgomyces ingoldianus]